MHEGHGRPALPSLVLTLPCVSTRGGPAIACCPKILFYPSRGGKTKLNCPYGKGRLRSWGRDAGLSSLPLPSPSGLPSPSPYHSPCPYGRGVEGRERRGRACLP